MTLHIDALKRHALLEEVFLQCVISLGHYDEAAKLLHNFESRQSRFVWAHIHAFLSHSSMVSKLLNSPSRSTKAIERSKFLSELLAVPSTSVIFERGARNNVEHQDERLDLWIEQDGGMLVEMVFDSREGFDFLIQPRSLEAKAKFIRRALILDEMVFVSQGREGVEFTKLIPLAGEIGRIASAAEARMNESQIPVR